MAGERLLGLGGAGVAFPSENRKNTSLVIYGKGDLSQIVRQPSLPLLRSFLHRDMDIGMIRPYFSRKHRLFLALRQCLELPFPQAHGLDGDIGLVRCLMEEDSLGEQGNHPPDLGRPQLGRAEDRAGAGREGLAAVLAEPPLVMVIPSVPLDMPPMAIGAFVEGTQRHVTEIERGHAEDSFPDIQRPVSEGNCYINPEPNL